MWYYTHVTQSHITHVTQCGIIHVTQSHITHVTQCGTLNATAGATTQQNASEMIKRNKLQAEHDSLQLTSSYETGTK
jgi:hypothetical protein